MDHSRRDEAPDATPKTKANLIRAVAAWLHPSATLDALTVGCGLDRPIRAVVRCGNFRGGVKIPMSATREECFRRLTEVGDELHEASRRYQSRTRTHE